MDWLQNQTVRELLLLLFLGAISSIVYQVVRRYVIKLLHKFFLKTRIRWDQILIEEGVLQSAALLIPVFIMAQGLPFLEVSASFAALLLRLWTLVIAVITFHRLLNVVVAVYNTFPIAQRVSIKGYVQVVQIAVIVFAAVLGISILVGQPPWAILGGLGALSAVLILVFQDTILGFVAGIQLTMNDQIRVGIGLRCPLTEPMVLLKK